MILQLLPLVALEAINQNALIKCASDIIENYAIESFAMVHTETGGDLANEILAITSKVKYENYNSQIGANNFFVAIVTNIIELQQLLPLIVRYLTSQTTLLIVNPTNDNHEVFLDASWESLVPHVAVLNSKLQIFGYNNLEMKNCTLYPNKQFLGRCRAKGMYFGSHRAYNGIFTYSTIVDYNGCPVRTMAFHIDPYVMDVDHPIKPGYEVKVINDVANKLNFAISYEAQNYSDWGYRLANGSYVMMYKWLIEKRIELVFGMVMANESFFDDFQGLYPHSRGFVSFYLPSANPVEPMMNLILVFTAELWYAILVTHVIFVLFWWVVGCLQHDFRREGYDHFWYGFTNCWAVFFNVSIKQPITFLMRSIFLYWTIYSFIAISVYQGVLISFLTNPIYEYQIKTVQEMVDVGFPRGGYHVIREVFQGDETAVYKDIYDNWIMCQMTLTCIERAANNRDMGIFKNVRTMNYIMDRYSHPSGRPKLYQLPPDVIYYIWMITYRGFVLYDAINDVLFRMAQSGLIDKYEREVQGRGKDFKDGLDGPVALSLKHLQAAFFMLILGLIIASGVFIGEMGVFYQHIKRQKDILGAKIK